MSESRKKKLERLLREAIHCRKCHLWKTRNRVVFGEGDASARVLFIGEAPGRQEDLVGRPFIGPSGELLTEMIERDMGISRSQVYVTSLVKCRPTVDMMMEKDRPPTENEIESCRPYLLGQIEIIQPDVIVALGGVATKSLLNVTCGITKFRGRWHDFNGIPVMPTFHPGYVLRNGGNKSPLRKFVRNDLKKVLNCPGWPFPCKEN